MVLSSCADASASPAATLLTPLGSPAVERMPCAHTDVPAFGTLPRSRSQFPPGPYSSPRMRCLSSPATSRAALHCFYSCPVLAHLSWSFAPIATRVPRLSSVNRPSCTPPQHRSVPAGEGGCGKMTGTVAAQFLPLRQVLRIPGRGGASVSLPPYSSRLTRH